MENISFYIPILFVATTLVTLLFLWKAADHSKVFLFAIAGWLLLQSAIGLSGFYLDTTGIPPRFILLIAPPVISILVLLLAKKGKAFIKEFDLKTLTILHIIRIPVELTLYALFLHKAVPEIMTFGGRNFDIISGITAPLMYYWIFIKKHRNRKLLLAWNILCLLLLINIVVTAILSAPFAFQKFGFDQPNIALFYFPFVWLPAFVVPAVLLAHMISIRKLVVGKKEELWEN